MEEKKSNEETYKQANMECPVQDKADFKDLELLKNPAEKKEDINEFLETLTLQNYMDFFLEEGIDYVDDFDGLCPTTWYALKERMKSGHYSRLTKALGKRGIFPVFSEISIPAQNLRKIVRNFLYAAFMSHYKDEAGGEARILKDRLAEHFPRNGIDLNLDDFFLDSDNLNNLEELLCFVQRSKYLIVVLSRKILTRPWCLLEIATAFRSNIEVFSVQPNFPADRKFDYNCFVEFSSNLKEAIITTLVHDPQFLVANGNNVEVNAQKHAEDCINKIIEFGFTVDEVQRAIQRLSNVIAKPFNNTKGSAAELTAHILDIAGLFRFDFES